MNANDLVEQLLRLCEKEARLLKRSAARVEALQLDLSRIIALDQDDQTSETLETFVARFARLQDMLGDKLLPAMLRATLEKTGTQLDNLFRAEKLGWIESAEQWVEFRALRNRLVHEYVENPADYLDALQVALRAVPVLTGMLETMQAYAVEHGLLERRTGQNDNTAGRDR
ncbi:hypothetical protein JCM16106_20180 [Hydrogenophilus islandicus]